MTNEEKLKVAEYVSRLKLEHEDEKKKIIRKCESDIELIEIDRDFALQKLKTTESDIEKFTLLKSTIKKRQDEYYAMRELMLLARDILVDIQNDVSDDTKRRIQEII